MDPSKPATGTVAERKYWRIPMRMPVSFRWSVPGGRQGKGQGVVLDVSAEGICIACLAGCPPADSTIFYEASIWLPEGEISTVRIKGTGYVVRTGKMPGTGMDLFGAHAKAVSLFAT